MTLQEAVIRLTGTSHYVTDVHYNGMAVRGIGVRSLDGDVLGIQVAVVDEAGGIKGLVTFSLEEHT